MMDHIAKRDFVKAEPTRLFFQTLTCWGIGPYVGVLLFVHVDPWAAHGLAAGASLVELLYFRAMRINDMALLAPRAPSRRTRCVSSSRVCAWPMPSP